MKDESRHSGRAFVHRSSFIVHRSRPAFTLVELLVVMGIIVLLISILVPLVMRSYRQAGRIRAQADLQAITTAIEAYKQDHGDIPRVLPAKYALTGTPSNLGAAILCKALLGPYGDGKPPSGTGFDNSDPPVYQATVDYAPGDVFRESTDSDKMYVTLANAPAGTPYNEASIFAPFDANDGADGIGFRKRLGGAGPVSPAYLQPSKIAFRGSMFMDHYGNPVLYFPANPRKRDLSDTGITQLRKPYVDQGPTSTTELPPLFDANDNFEMLARRGGDGRRLLAEQSSDKILLTRMRMMLGDFNANGFIDTVDGPETAVTAPYLLWTAGPDGMIGPVGIDIPASDPSPEQASLFRSVVPKCDDILNFR